mgnify:CR=1 FL=1|tara:strand:- start:545 stop:1339 length:795 start_codon:yes stop_codon:yes gene_type:complete
MFYKQILSYISKDDAEFIYTTIGIDNFSELSQSRLRFLYRHIRENHRDYEGDIFEFGVFRGASLIAMAMLLKQLGSDKKIYGFDSFSGFPRFNEKDSLSNFSSSDYKESFSAAVLDRFEMLSGIKSKLLSMQINEENISTSSNFSDTSLDALKKKIDLLGLDNIVLIDGDFKKTLPIFFEDHEIDIFAANLDCDLYDGYEIALPFIWDGLVKGGYLHLDEYYSLKFPGAKLACDKFFKEKNISPNSHVNIRPGEFERFYITKGS